MKKQITEGEERECVMRKRRKRLIERAIDLIEFGYGNDFISMRTGLTENRVNNIREIMEGKNE